MLGMCLRMLVTFSVSSASAWLYVVIVRRTQYLGASPRGAPIDSMFNPELLGR